MRRVRNGNSLDADELTLAGHAKLPNTYLERILSLAAEHPTEGS